MEGVSVESVSVLQCFNCSLNLTGHRYILRDDKPFCIPCYESLFANKCEECKQAIGTDFKVRTAYEMNASKCAQCRDARIAVARHHKPPAAEAAAEVAAEEQRH